MKFSSIPPENLQILGGIDDFLPDSAQIFVLVAKTKVRHSRRTFGGFFRNDVFLYLDWPVMVMSVRMV